jgi:hypothetical protein
MKNNSVKEILSYLNETNYRTEMTIQEDVFSYYRNDTWESNKKYAYMLRRGVTKGLIGRVQWKRKHESRPYFYYYITNTGRKFIN